MRSLLFIWVFIVPSFAVAGPMPRGEFVESEVKLRPVPTGIGMSASVGRRAPFYSNEHLALEHNGIAYGAYVQFSPVSLHPGVFMKVIPLTVLELEFGVQALSYFGVLNSVLSYPSTQGFGIARLKLKVSSVVLVSEYEFRHLQLLGPKTEAWFDPERNLLMKSTDTYQRSLSILGWLFGPSMSNAHILAMVSWSEFNTLKTSHRHLGGLGLIRQHSTGRVNTRWLVILATYLEDQYQSNELFGAFVWKRSWSL
jgi:hypothetical protein